jgi:DNA-binding NarL/FixJ family response regulator
LEINHKDGDKRNNCVDNLEYVTASENIRHALRTGLMVPAKGAQVGSSKLTNRQVRRIRERHAAGASMSEIARRMKLGLTTVSDIVARRTWAHI